jgi:hypothetical protein
MISNVTLCIRITTTGCHLPRRTTCQLLIKVVLVFCYRAGRYKLAKRRHVDTGYVGLAQYKVTLCFSVDFNVKNDDFHCFSAIFNENDNNTMIIILYNTVYVRSRCIQKWLVNIGILVSSKICDFKIFVVEILQFSPENCTRDEAIHLHQKQSFFHETRFYSICYSITCILDRLHV